MSAAQPAIRAQLGRPQQHAQLALLDPGQTALLHPHLRAGERVHGHGEVGVVAHQQHVLAAPGGERLGVERIAGQLGLELGLGAQRLAGEPRRLDGADLRAREAGVELHAERRERLARGPRLLLALVGEGALGVR